MGIILTSTAIVHPWDIHPVVQPTAKVCVKNLGGAIRRKDTTGIGSVDSGRLVDVSGSVAQLPTNSPVANAKGLESHPPGSAGKLSRSATVKLLIFPPPSVAQRWLKSVVASNGFWCIKPRQGNGRGHLHRNGPVTE
jgi:hypothetical protein